MEDLDAEVVALLQQRVAPGLAGGGDDDDLVCGHVHVLESDCSAVERLRLLRYMARRVSPSSHPCEYWRAHAQGGRCGRLSGQGGSAILGRHVTSRAPALRLSFERKE